MKRRLITRLAKNWKKNVGDRYVQQTFYRPDGSIEASPPERLEQTDFEPYVQTWFYIPGGRMGKILQWLCGFFGGHELSLTEWGYGGGDYADRRCRWCDKVVQVPKEEIYFVFKDCNPKEMMNEVDGDK